MFYFDNIFGFKVLKSSFLDNINSFFTTKELILKTKEKENIKSAENNIRLLKEGFNLKDILTPSQRHTCNIKAAIQGEDFSETDALILADTNCGIFLNFADCTPVILYDKKQNIGAISHAGWRGTVQKIAPNTVLKMQNEFNSNIEDIMAVIGPCICCKCFETSEEIAIQLAETIGNTEFIRRRGKNFYADLKKINAAQLIAIGIKNIDISEYCTCCDNDKFFSYRKENQTTNRMSAFLSLKN